MKLTKIVKTAIKFGPILLPVVMKIVNNKKESESNPNPKRKR